MMKMALLAIGRCIGTRPEPSISEILSDPLVKTLIEADGIDPEVLKAELWCMAQQIFAKHNTSD
jgi:hypothetical protein